MKSTKPFTKAGIAIACGALVVLLPGCGPTDNQTSSTSDTAGNEAASAASTATPPPATTTPPAAASDSQQSATAQIDPTQGNNVRGTVTFTKEGNGVRVVADLTGLSPGEHGFHIHEKGDCSSPDGSSAGGHFNPTAQPHGAPGAAQHHLGDLGNLTADDTGKAHLDQVFDFLTLSGENGIVGRGVIVHAAKDDLTSQPVGNAGGRQGCGVIK